MPDVPDSDFSNAEQIKLPLNLPASAMPVRPTERSSGSARGERRPKQAKPPAPPLMDLDPQPNFFSLLQEKDSGGIEILVQMAARGELDPKNIDIIDATDRFLRAIAAAPRENLRQSGKIIFHACVLLRLKAEALLITKIEDLDVGGDDYVDFDLDGSPIIYDSNDQAVGRQITLADLQRALVRRSKQKQSRSRRVTLEQLIESLREAEQLEKKRLERKEREPKAVIQMDGYHEMEDMDDILDLAHDEDIEDVIARIEQLLVKTMERLLRLTLTELLGMMGGNGDWVDAFLAVLFLSNSGKLELEQDKFYGPLYLVRNNEQNALGAEGSENNNSTPLFQVVPPSVNEPLSSSETTAPLPFEKPNRSMRAANNVKRDKSDKVGNSDRTSKSDKSSKSEKTSQSDTTSRPVRSIIRKKSVTASNDETLSNKESTESVEGNTDEITSKRKSKANRHSKVTRSVLVESDEESFAASKSGQANLKESFATLDASDSIESVAFKSDLLESDAIKADSIKADLVKSEAGLALTELEKVITKAAIFENTNSTALDLVGATPCVARGNEASEFEVSKSEDYANDSSVFDASPVDRIEGDESSFAATKSDRMIQAVETTTNANPLVSPGSAGVGRAASLQSQTPVSPASEIESTSQLES